MRTKYHIYDKQFECACRFDLLQVTIKVLHIQNEKKSLQKFNASVEYHYSTPKNCITYSKVGGLVFVTFEYLSIL